MIKAETKQLTPHGYARRMSCELHGPLLELGADMLHILRQVYQQISEENPTGGEIFKSLVTDAVNGEGGFELWESDPNTVQIGTRRSASDEAGQS